MKKVTKRQRKLMNGPNSATLTSLQQKERHGDYFGVNPVYANQARPFDVPDYRKIMAGIPFVRPSNFGM